MEVLSMEGEALKITLRLFALLERCGRRSSGGSAPLHSFDNVDRAWLVSRLVSPDLLSVV